MTEKWQILPLFFSESNVRVRRLVKLDDEYIRRTTEQKSFEFKQILYLQEQ